MVPDIQAQFESRQPATDRPYSVPKHPHLWLRYRDGGKGWRICKWCGLTQSPEEQALPPTTAPRGEGD